MKRNKEVSSAQKNPPTESTLSQRKKKVAGGEKPHGQRERKNDTLKGTNKRKREKQRVISQAIESERVEQQKQKFNTFKPI